MNEAIWTDKGRPMKISGMRQINVPVSLGSLEGGDRLQWKEELVAGSDGNPKSTGRFMLVKV